MAKFHAVKLVNDAVDKVRRAESKGRPELKRSRYLWLRNEPSLSAEARANLAALTRLHLKTARAYQIRLAFQEIYRQPNWDRARCSSIAGTARRSDHGSSPSRRRHAP